MTTDVVGRGRPFCSDAARSRGDDATATAARIDAWLLVEFAGAWGREPIRDAALPESVRQTLVAAVKLIPRSRLLFIRRRVDGRSACRVIAARSQSSSGYGVLDLPGIDDVAGVDFPALLDAADVAAPPLILICTHGQHDSCCGRRGYPLYDALGRSSGVEVWQCSHVGGDRFAANALVLPWGILYGPVEPREADALVGSVLNDDIYLSAYRGRTTMSRAAQAAETFVRNRHGLRGRDAVGVTRREDLEGGRTVIELADTGGRRHRVVVEQYRSTESAFTTCTSRVTDSIQQYRVLDYRDD